MSDTRSPLPSFVKDQTPTPPPGAGDPIPGLIDELAARLWIAGRRNPAFAQEFGIGDPPTELADRLREKFFNLKFPTIIEAMIDRSMPGAAETLAMTGYIGATIAARQMKAQLIPQEKAIDYVDSINEAALTGLSPAQHKAMMAFGQGLQKSYDSQMPANPTLVSANDLPKTTLAWGGSKNNNNNAGGGNAVPPGVREVMNELDSLIGMSDIKEQVERVYCLTRLWQDRLARGEQVERPSLHLVFTGNPGTGKTTVARVVGRLLKEMGVLRKGHMVETDRSGLVAEYVGQTAPKVKKVCREATDGILFIDEAYALIPKDASGIDYGHEALAVLLKEMEDKREKLVVIIAGYPNEMGRMLDSNPGLRSRFPRRIDFPDYKTSELAQILDLMLKKRGYTIDDDAKVDALKLVDAERSSKHFGNGRTVRNLVEYLEAAMAHRIYIHELREGKPAPADVKHHITLEDVKRIRSLNGGVDPNRRGGNKPPGDNNGGGGFGPIPPVPGPTGDDEHKPKI